MPDSVGPISVTENYSFHIDQSPSVVLRTKLASEAIVRYGIVEEFRDPGIGRNLISTIYSNSGMMPSFSSLPSLCWSRIWWNPSNCLECSGLTLTVSGFAFPLYLHGSIGLTDCQIFIHSKMVEEILTS
jgi:hypothetical protein